MQLESFLSIGLLDIGLARAATAAKDPAAAQRAYAELREIWKKADPTLPELKEVGALRPQS